MPKQYGLAKGSEESNLVTFKDGFQKSGNSMLKTKNYWFYRWKNLIIFHEGLKESLVFHICMTQHLIQDFLSHVKTSLQFCVGPLNDIDGQIDCIMF